MPASPSSPCRHPGCGELLPSKGYCNRHTRPACKSVYDQTTRKTDPRLAESARIRNSSRWQRFRHWFRDRHPLCCDPFQEHGDDARPMAQVHHVLPLATHPELACAEDNCRPLCTACHARVERIERNGDSTAPLFALKRAEVAH